MIYAYCIRSILCLCMGLLSINIVNAESNGERMKTMNNSSNWLTTVHEIINSKTAWQFTEIDDQNRPIVIEWQTGNITSTDLANFKKTVSDLAAATTAATEMRFLKRF